MGPTGTTSTWSLRDEDFSPAEVRFLWPGGSVDDEPLLLGPRDNYRRTARYFCKERTDGVVLPIGARTWVASRSLYRQPAAAGEVPGRTGEIPVPPDAAWAEENAVRNPFGAYRYAAYIEPNPSKRSALYIYLKYRCYISQRCRKGGNSIAQP